MVSVEKQWHISEYADDIHNYLRQKEKKRYFYREQSSQLEMRKPLVTWISELVDKQTFCSNVKHLAVYLLDIFLDNHTCQAKHLKMVAVVCLIIAGCEWNGDSCLLHINQRLYKYNSIRTDIHCIHLLIKVEEDSVTPRNSVFNKIMGNQYKLSEFVQMELDILSFFNCDVMLPTAAHFVDYYSLYALSPCDTIEGQGEPAHNPKSLKVYVKKYIEYFLNLTLLDVVFYKYPPSLIAAACILATRSCLSLSPPWPVSLQSITCYKYGQVKPCMDIMLRTLNTQVAVNIASQICDSSASNVSVNPVFVVQS